MKGGSEYHLTAQLYRLEQWSKITLFLPNLSRLHQFGSKVLAGIFLGYALHAGRIWKGDILVADIEDLEKMDASEMHARRLNAKDVSTPMNGEKFPVADGNSPTLRRRSGSENIHLHPGSPRPRKEQENL